MDLSKIKWFNNGFVPNNQHCIYLSYGYDNESKYSIFNNKITRYDLKDTTSNEGYNPELKEINTNEIHFIIENSKIMSICEFNKIISRLQKIKYLKNK